MKYKQDIKARLLTNSTKDPTTGCWNWTAYQDRDGYGNISVNRKNKQTHRVSYEVFVGPLQEGLLICHTCDNPSCINPAHLYQGTHKDNQKDKAIRQRIVGEKHPYGKLKDEDVLAIRASTDSQSKLAVKYGVIQAHISRIKRRVNWTHI